MRGGVGALCLSSLECDPFASRDPDESGCHQDRHKAPASAPPLSLSLQDEGDSITLFGRQKSSDVPD